MKLRRIISCALAAVMAMSVGVTALADGETAVKEKELFKKSYDMTKVKPKKDEGIIFEENLANGDYTVTVKTGGDTETNANIYINGGERVRAYTLEAGETQDNVQPVVVTDGKLTVQVLGDNPNVTEIAVDEIAPRTEPGMYPTIYIAGDSTAQTYDYSKVFPQTGWGQVFSEMFKDEIIIDNRSMGGRSSKSYNNDGRLDKILTELKPGDYVFIQFGINDGAENKPERYISVEDYKKLITEKYIGETVKRGGIPVLMTATAASWWDEENNNFMESRADYADPTRELAKELGVKFIDINRIMTDTWNAMTKDDVLDGYFICEPLESKAYPSGTDDHTHLKRNGALKIAELIAQAIPESVPELAKYLKGEEKFTDIDGHWAKEYITALAAKNLVNGIGNGEFGPDKWVTRAQFLKMAMDAANIPQHAYREGECLNVEDTDWFAPYVQSALDKGLIPCQMINNCDGAAEYDSELIIAEATDEKPAQTAKVTTYFSSSEDEMSFDTDTPITREEMTVIAMNCFSYALKNASEPIEFEPFPANETAFTDSDIYEEYVNSIDAAVSYGIVNGMGDGTFAPKAQLTRAQAAAITLRIANLLK